MVSATFLCAPNAIYVQKKRQRKKIISIILCLRIVYIKENINENTLLSKHDTHISEALYFRKCIVFIMCWINEVNI